MLGNIKVRGLEADTPGLRAPIPGPNRWPSNHTRVLQKLRDRQLASPAESENVQDLCRNELKTKKHTATEGLLWLVRYARPRSHTPLE